MAGRPAPRREDLRLLTGRGAFIADLPLRGAAEAAVLRSPHAHARVLDIDVGKARELPGVDCVMTGRELVQLSDPILSVVRGAPEYRPLAVDRVRYDGEPVAVVVARDRYVAEDALELIRVEYEPLEAVIEPDAALAPGAPALHESHPGNVAWHRRYRYGDPELAFASADLVVGRDFVFPSYSSIPLETYGMVCEYEGPGGRYVVHCNFQGPFTLHSVAARALRVPDDRLRMVVARDVGGSFGSKAMLYPYVVLMSVAARLAGRPVRWIEDRLEHLKASSRASDRSCRFELAVTRDGRLLGLRARILENVGAYLRPPEPASIVRVFANLQGAYHMQGLELDASAVLTNRVPTGLNRGYGGPQHYFPLERLVDEAAHELGIDPVELRRRNLIRPEEFPFRSLSGGLYDSGDYPEVLRRAVALSGYQELRARQRGGRRDGRLRGVGVAAVVDSSTSNMGYVTLALDPSERARPGYLPKSGSLETARVKMDSNGQVAVSISTAGAGQSHETVAAEVAAAALGIPPEQVQVEDRMDTASSVWSVSSGSYSSRFAAMTASAVHRAAVLLREKLIRAAAEMLEADPRDLELGEGAVAVRGAPERRVPLRRIAGMAHWNPEGLGAGLDGGLEASATFRFPGLDAPGPDDRVNASGCYGFMVDVAVVEVDPETGTVEVADYVSVHDAGRVLDRVVLRGQRWGAFAHGLAAALYEELVHGPDGQLLTATLADYLCPTASEMPPLRLDDIETPSPFTPLGAKGCADGSCTPAPVAIANAVADALRSSGVTVERLPFRPAEVWRRLQGAASAR
jgi:2-furoyl-CoA dehydrogenase large subunit